MLQRGLHFKAGNGIALVRVRVVGVAESIQLCACILCCTITMAEQGNTDELAHVYDSVPYEESGLYDDPSPLLDNYEKQTTTAVR